MRAATPEAIHEQAIASAFARYPDLVRGRESFPRHVQTWDGESLGRWSGDLYLAHACLCGDARATTLLREMCLKVIRESVMKIDSSSFFADELLQNLMSHLLVGEGRALEKYRASGSLEGFVRLVAVRLAIDAKRREERDPLQRSGETHDAEGIGFAGAQLSPEFAYLQQMYAAPIQSALERAWVRLSADERNLLRLHFVEGLSIDALAKIFSLHRSSVARWAHRVRARLFEDVRMVLAEQMGASPSECDSLLALVDSQLGVSLSGLAGA